MLAADDPFLLFGYFSKNISPHEKTDPPASLNTSLNTNREISLNTSRKILPNTITETNTETTTDAITEANDSPCQHLSIVTDLGVTTCVDCGEEIRHEILQEKDTKSYKDTRSISDGSRCFSHPVKVKTIRDEVRALGFEEPIISEAEKIYQNVSGDHPFRSNKRKSVILACVFKAHKIHKIDINLEYLLKRFDLKKTAAHNGIKLVSLKIKNYDTERQYSTYITPQDFINDLLSLWDTDPVHYNNIHRLYNLIASHSNLTNRSRPKSIAAGVIYYYIQRTGRNITLKEFSQRCDMTETTVIKLCKDIKTVVEGK